MNWNAKWIKPQRAMGDVCPVFQKDFTVTGTVREAKLLITALGVYEAAINGSRIGNFVLAPGWTTYKKRLQYQEYDLTGLLQKENRLTVHVGKGWYRSPMPGWVSQEDLKVLHESPAGLFAQLVLTMSDGTTALITSDESWTVAESCIRFSEIYDGEIYDASYIPADPKEAVTVFDGPSDTLIPQQGEEIREQERVSCARIFTTPKGEKVIDFGQEVTGYVETCLKASSGDIVSLSFAEVMDKDGNFYNENYRSAKALYEYTCTDGYQTWQPKLTFYGFRYARINSFPGGVQKAAPEHFTAVVVHSQLKRTGTLCCSDAELNKLFDNILWGQKGNFLDVPTDCPQRDERLGWTGDAQVFIRTACLNYDVEKFFTKWLADMAADQKPDGRIGHVIPDWIPNDGGSAAWGDAATICPWELYLAYGNPQILKNQFECMKKWVSYITTHSNDPCLWTGHTHFGDWLGLDAPSGSYKGSSREDLIASAFYAHSTALVIKAGKVIGADVAEFEALYQSILAAFRKTYPDYRTQTECALAVYFNLASDAQKTCDQLAAMVQDCGIRLQTGFVGTPYLLHVLSSYGYASLAYALLLRREYPSWLYPVTKGATTIWEHWDGIMENGDFWSSDMNSYNHYAYGAVADWVYSVAAGIRTMEEFPGYERVEIAPVPDSRLDWLSASYDSARGMIRSSWKKEKDQWRYEIETPVEAHIVIDNRHYDVKKGTYLFFGKIDH